MSLLRSLIPNSMVMQMIAVLALSFTVLLIILTAFEIADQHDVTEWAGHETTLRRIHRIRSVLEVIQPDRIGDFLASTSSCHQGYSVTRELWNRSINTETSQNGQMRVQIASELGLSEENVQVSAAVLDRQDFSYSQCEADEIIFPVEGIVISTQLTNGFWLNAEVHPHEWHLQDDMLVWLLRSTIAFLVVGAAAIFFIRRLNRPLKNLTRAAERFGSGLEVSQVETSGPSDLQRTISAFNQMQADVTDQIQRRSNTLAAISHDVRSPLTALRLKVELIEDKATRSDLLTSINKMEKITASALSYLKGEARHEPIEHTDLALLIQDICEEARDLGYNCEYHGPASLTYLCRPEALRCAIINLVENACKYAGPPQVSLKPENRHIEITVSDSGPGIPEHRIQSVLQPFERLSAARESQQGGFGLGLAIVKQICEGHDGRLVLSANQPTGLIATIQLPLNRIA